MPARFAVIGGVAASSPRTAVQIVSRDTVKIVDRGDHLGGDAVALGSHAQKHLEQFDSGCAIWRGSETLQPR